LPLLARSAANCKDCHVGHILPDDLPVGMKRLRGMSFDPNNAEALWRKVKKWLENLLPHYKQ
jgi:hypothetical protein